MALWISIGSFLVTLVGLISNIHGPRKNRRIERARVYDKVYHDASDLLIYNYRLRREEPYMSDDKFLEKAVNEYESFHWLEQMYGYNLEYPAGVESEEEKKELFPKSKDGAR